MKLLYPFCTFILLIGVLSCHEKNGRSSGGPTQNPYTEAYKYFPLSNGYQWKYEKTHKDSLKQNTDSIQLKGVYSKDSACINFFQNNILHSILYWSNQGGIMGCCGDKVLIDYNEIETTKDSVLIYIENTLPLSYNYQYRGQYPAPNSDPYSTYKCIRTKQYYNFQNGNKRITTRYFGYTIGLLREEILYLDSNGKILWSEILKLVSHQF